MYRSSAVQVQEGARVLREEARAILELADRLNHNFSIAVDRLANCSGAVIVSGIGKSGLVGQKLSATLTSTGTRSFFLHPVEARHGDLGCLGQNDVVVVLSYSGETEEIIALLPWLVTRGLEIIAITRSADSTLGRSASIVIEIGSTSEACVWGLVPTCSSAMMMAVGDAIALATSHSRGFDPDCFRGIHPGGEIGRGKRLIEQLNENVEPTPRS